MTISLQWIILIQHIGNKYITVENNFNFMLKNFKLKRFGRTGPQKGNHSATIDPFYQDVKDY